MPIRNDGISGTNNPPIVNDAVTPPTTTTTDPYSGLPQPTGLDVATTNGPAPAIGNDGVRSGTGPTGVSVVDAAFGSGVNRTSPFELVPGRYPGTVGLPQVIAQLGNSPQAKGMVKKVIADFEATTGVEVPRALVNAALANPARLVDILMLSPEQMSAGFDALNAAHQAGQIQDVAPRTYNLPKTFDLANIDSAAVERPEPHLKELAPGLLQGNLKSDLPDAQAKRNIVMAEVFDRLATNAGQPRGERFAVRYDGGQFTRLDTFLKALQESGHQIEVVVRHRVANFANLKTKAPDGTILDVPTPLLVRTGVRDDAGNEAVVPSVHSELVINVTPGPNATGDAITAEVKWYQGVTTTGFFPCGLHQNPAWLGGTTVDSFSGDAATKAVELAGLLGDLITDVAKDRSLIASGYGITGVCNDSVAIIQHAMAGRTTAYPLMMRDATLMGDLETRLADRDRRDDPEYRTLAASILAVPSDVGGSPDLNERAVASIPWEPGRDPLASTEQAREILAG